MMDFITSAECAKKWHISQRRVSIYCKQGRIKGAILISNRWLIPKDAEKPQDPRKTKRRKEE